MLRRPILLNRPVKSKKAAVYRPGAAQPASEDSDVPPTQGLRTQGLKTLGIERVARLAAKLEECANVRWARASSDLTGSRLRSTGPIKML